jgi:hypothetical protein
MVLVVVTVAVFVFVCVGGGLFEPGDPQPSRASVNAIGAKGARERDVVSDMSTSFVVAGARAQQPALAALVHSICTELAHLQREIITAANAAP